MSFNKHAYVLTLLFNEDNFEIQQLLVLMFFHEEIVSFPIQGYEYINVKTCMYACEIWSANRLQSTRIQADFAGYLTINK